MEKSFGSSFRDPFDPLHGFFLGHVFHPQGLGVLPLHKVPAGGEKDEAGLGKGLFQRLEGALRVGPLHFGRITLNLPLNRVLPDST